METDDRLAFWLASPNFAQVEIARALGFRRIVLEVEHGVWGTVGLDHVTAYAKALGYKVFAKVLGPEPVPIMQALDFGAEGVIIPHIEDVAHAFAVTRWTKYPPVGKRSFSGGRTVGYDVPAADFFEAEDRRTQCLPMIESAAALADAAAILALPTVDGLFVGPSDLSLDRGRGKYRRTEADARDLEAIADAARAAGKPWVMPGWTSAERRHALALGAAWMVVADDTGSFAAGLEAARDAALADLAT